MKPDKDYFDGFTIAEHVQKKEKNILDEWSREFIAHATLLFIASAGLQGNITVSPRGGVAGFVRVRSETECEFDDEVGNNRFETYTNILEKPDVSLIFIIPGINETLRVKAFARLEFSGVAPQSKTAARVIFQVRTAYYHCGRSLKFSGIWDEETVRKNSQHSPVQKRPRPD